MILSVVIPMLLMPDFYNLTLVSSSEVVINDAFWSSRQKTNREVTLMHGFAMLKEHGYEENFKRAGDRLEDGFKGLVFQDSDVYKVLESVATSLAAYPDAKVQKEFDRWVGLIERAQMDDGYINTYFQLKEPAKKWTNLRDWHELYCVGHLVEAGVADFVGTRNRRLLNVAIKAADHVERRFGPDKLPGYPGHPELELALIKLFRATGETKYYNLARHFVKARGTHYFAREHNTPEGDYDGTYWQDRVPIANADVIEGHAVRAAYLLSAATDIVGETKDPDLETMIRRVWNNATGKRMYVTGGIGNSSSNEGFTKDYDLPNESAYQETCASIAMVFWNQRMAMLYGDSKYADAMERALYNGVLSGISIDGRKFFYENPLASAGGHHRRDWYACACCPPNISRLLSSLGSYIYAKGEDSIWVNLFVAGTLATTIDGEDVKLKVVTDYPWSGKVSIMPTAKKPLEVRVRIPDWCDGFVFRVGGKQLSPKVDRGYAIVKQAWDGKTAIEIEFPMPVRRLQSHPAIEANHGRSAIARGPMIYCLEQVDQSVDIDRIFVPIETRFDVRNGEFGTRSLVGKAFAIDRSRWPGGIYREVSEPKTVEIRAIPYAFWDNRAPGKMAVWLPTDAPAPRDIGREGDAKVTASFQNENSYIEGVNDGEITKSSGEQPGKLCHFWPHKGGREWIQYDFDEPVQITGMKVYFFDDTGRGECRIAKGWHAESLQNGKWTRIDAVYKSEIDKWSEVRFPPTASIAFRLVVEMQDGWAAGVHEWKLIED